MTLSEEANIYLSGIQSYNIMSVESLTLLKKNLKILAGQAQLEEGMTVLDVVKTLDKELERSRADLPRKLVHFLENRSYEKALIFIESNRENIWRKRIVFQPKGIVGS